MTYGSMNLYSQGRYTPNRLIPILENGKWGYCDSNKTILIPCKYEMAYPFSRKDYSGSWNFSDQGIVKYMGLFYLIDKNGKLSEENSELRYLEDMDVVEYKTVDYDSKEEGEMQNKPDVFIDVKGSKYKIIKEYSYLYQVSNNDNKEGIVEKRGMQIAVPIEQDSVIFSDQSELWRMFFCKKGNLWGMYYGNRKLTDYTFSNLSFVGQTVYDSLNFIVVGKKNGKVLFLDQNAEILPWGEYEDVKIYNGSKFYPFFFVVKKKGKWGAITNIGKMIVSFEYDFIDDKYCMDRLLYVKNKNKKGFIDLRGVKYF